MLLSRAMISYIYKLVFTWAVSGVAWLLLFGLPQAGGAVCLVAGPKTSPQPHIIHMQKAGLTAL